jgi:hypothetical protein
LIVHGNCAYIEQYSKIFFLGITESEKLKFTWNFPKLKLLKPWPPGVGWGQYRENCFNLSASCLVAHKASAEFIHPSLFAAATLASAHDPHPLSPLSFSTVLLHVVLGLSLFLVPSGVQDRAMFFSEDVAYEFPSSIFYFLAQWSHA